MASYVQRITNAKNLFLSLVFNNINYKDIKEFKLTKKNNKKYINILLNDNTFKIIPYSEYKLTKQAAITSAITTAIGACALVGTIASFKYSNNNDNIKLNAFTNVDNNQIEDVIEPSEETTIQTENNYVYTAPIETEAIVEPQAVVQAPVQTDIVETTLTDDSFIEPTYTEPENIEDDDEVFNENETIRYINVSGDPSRDESVYEYIMNNYYDDILEFGITYGVDPSIIAAIMMQEGSNLYNPAADENYAAIGFGQLNGNIWNGASFNTYNFMTQSYEQYKINTDIVMNNPREQIKVIAIMLQDSAIRYNGNLNAMLICYNQGMTTVSNITSQIVSNNSQYDNSLDVYTAVDPLLLDNSNPYTYGDPEYTNKISTFMSYVLNNQDFGRDCASINLPSGEIYTYYISTDLDLAR